MQENEKFPEEDIDRLENFVYTLNGYKSMVIT